MHTILSSCLAVIIGFEEETYTFPEPDREAGQIMNTRQICMVVTQGRIEREVVVVPRYLPNSARSKCSLSPNHFPPFHIPSYHLHSPYLPFLLFPSSPPSRALFLSSCTILPLPFFPSSLSLSPLPLLPLPPPSPRSSILSHFLNHLLPPLLSPFFSLCQTSLSNLVSCLLSGGFRRS